MNELYTYYVSVWKPITGLSNGTIYTSKCTKLTKDDVLKCLENGAKVFRRFNANDPMVQITKGNVDRYHTDNLLSDDEFKQHKIEEAAAGAKEVHVDPLPDEVKEEEPVVEEEKIETVALEVEEVPEPVEDQTPEEEIVTEDDIPEEIVTEESSEEPVENTEVAEEVQNEVEEVEEDTSSDISTDDTVIIDGNYSGKRKKNHKK